MLLLFVALPVKTLTQVQGDLKDLEASQGATNPNRLPCLCILSNCSGRSPWKELKLLNELDLSKNADVTGELYSLLELGELREVRLRDTQVRGHLDSVLAGSLNHLRFLDLSVGPSVLGMSSDF